MRIFFLPRLHPQFTSPEWPNFFHVNGIEPLFWGVGLPAENANNTKDIGNSATYTPAYIWNFAEAKAFLRDAASVQPPQVRLQQEAALAKPLNIVPPLSTSEEEDLNAFANGKTLPVNTDSADATNSLLAKKEADAAELQRCHQILLLAWLRENDFLEMESLTKQFHSQKNALADALNDPTNTSDSDHTPLPGTSFPLPPPTAEDLPNGQYVLYAVSPFLPPSATSDTQDALFLNSEEFSFSHTPPCDKAHCPLHGKLPPNLTCNRTSIASLLAKAPIGIPVHPAAHTTRCCFTPKHS